MGASGLPVGMLSPHVTRAPTPLSRLCSLGVADARTQLERLVPQGQGWQAAEVDNLGHDPGRWPAAVVRPSALVLAWLAEAQASGSLRTRFDAPVANLVREDGQWVAKDGSGAALGTAPAVVMTSAYGALPLLDGIYGPDTGAVPLRPVKGQLTLAALQAPPLAPRPMRNNGVFVPAYEDAGLAPAWPSRVWAMGSTYERGRDDTTMDPAAHERNAASLEDMHPQAAAELRRCASEGRLLGWSQVRCASQDRLPMVGAAPDLKAMQELFSAAGARRGRIPLQQAPRLPGLFMLTALGSRGLTLAHWCADWLAGRMSGEPSPLTEQDLDLEKALDPARFAWKAARRQPAA